MLAGCLAIGGALGALYGVALMATAVTGSSSPSSILLAGFGFMLLVLSLALLAFAIRQWKTANSNQGN